MAESQQETFTPYDILNNSIKRSIYVEKVLRPKLFWLNFAGQANINIPIINNPSGEWTDVISDIPSEPIETSTFDPLTGNVDNAEPTRISEGSDFDVVELGMGKTRTGTSYLFGYRFNWTLQSTQKPGFEQRWLNKLNSLINGMARKFNNEVGKQILNGAGNIIPNDELSDWANLNEIDPRIDRIKLNRLYAPEETIPFELTDLWTSRLNHETLCEFYTSLDLEYDFRDVNVDGLSVKSAGQAFDNLADEIGYDTLAIDRSTPGFMIQASVFPQFNSIQQAIDNGPERNINQPLINIHYSNNEQQKENPMLYSLFMFGGIGAEIQEPKAIGKIRLAKP